MMNIAIITSGYLPVPASKGGAVENIVESWLIENEKYQEVKFTIFSIYDEKASELSKKYKHSDFEFIKEKKIINFCDKIIYWLSKNILKKEKTMSYRYIIQRLYFLNKVSKILKKDNYDKIIIENHPTLFFALKMRKNYLKYDGKFYYHVHNEINGDYGCTEIIAKSKKILCVSNYIKQNIKEKLGIYKNVEVMKNCINVENFNKKLKYDDFKKVREKYNISENDIVLIFSGRVTKQKGIIELLKAMKDIKEHNVKLLIVGSFFFGTKVKNNFEIEIEEMIKQCNNKVITTGYIPYDEISKLYAISDIAVLPSICEDAAPLTIIEAMASGLPIITTNSGGIPEYAQNGCACILYRNNELVKNLTNTIEKLVKDKEKIQTMSKISLRNSKELNLDNFYKNLMQKLKET